MLLLYFFVPHYLASMDSKLHQCSEGHAVGSHFFLAQGSSNCCLQRMVRPVEFKIVLEVWRKILD